MESDTGVDPGFLDSYRFNFTKWEGGGGGGSIWLLYLLNNFIIEGVSGELCGSATWILFTATALTVFSSTYGDIAM